MPGDPRPWEQRHVRDVEVVDRPAGLVAFGAFLLAGGVAVALVGVTAAGFLAGGVAGGIVAVAVSKLLVRSQQGTRRGPPPDLL
jgi:hypothetical protein